LTIDVEAIAITLICASLIHRCMKMSRGPYLIVAPWAWTLIAASWARAVNTRLGLPGCVVLGEGSVWQHFVSWRASLGFPAENSGKAPARASRRSDHFVGSRGPWLRRVEPRIWATDGRYNKSDQYSETEEK
jgi:hypothetical protein